MSAAAPFQPGDLAPWLALARRYFEHRVACPRCPAGLADECAEGLAIREQALVTLAAVWAKRDAEAVR